MWWWVWHTVGISAQSGVNDDMQSFTYLYASTMREGGKPSDFSSSLSFLVS